jgi:hypothetical protein
MVRWTNGLSGATKRLGQLSRPLISEVRLAPTAEPCILAQAGTYAFAPATFALIRDFAPSLAFAPATSAPYLFVAAAAIQTAAIMAFLLGRRPQQSQSMPT